MTGVLKVYGFTAMNPHTNPKVQGAQVRVIIAAKSVAELTRITGVSRRDYAWSGSVTANDDECAQALAEPGVAYMRALNDTRALWVEYHKQAKGEPMGTPRGRVVAKPLDRPIVEPKIPLTSDQATAIECPLCNGTGTTPQEAYRYGLGRQVGAPCPACEGRGRASRDVATAWLVGFEMGQSSAYIGRYDQYDTGSLMFKDAPENPYGGPGLERKH